jgi:ribosomal protein L3 glutamine methyltransferase
VLERLQQRVEPSPAGGLPDPSRPGWREFRFHVDPRVIVPRSYFAEPARRRLRSLARDTGTVAAALDLCTGSGCLAIVMAHAFSNAHIDAVDLSPDALAVARRNIADYGLEDAYRSHRIRPLRSLEEKALRPDHLQPALCHGSGDGHPAAEYRHEPALALAAGADGLDVVRRILAQAHKYLKPGGVLAIEVGHNQDLVTAAFPDLPAVWLDTAQAEGKVFVLPREDLPAAKSRGA